jgi:hypothetical protein
VSAGWLAYAAAKRPSRYASWLPLLLLPLLLLRPAGAASEGVFVLFVFGVVLCGVL